MYIEKKRIKNNEYLYLKESNRINNKVKTKTIAYLGRSDLSKKELKKRIESFKDKIDIKFLKEKQLENLRNIKKDFALKLKNKDIKLKEDMFKDFKTYYIYNTNAIEGNSLTLPQTDLLLNENITPKNKDLREIHDHINEKETFDFIIKKRPEINKKIIVELHSRLLKNIDNRTGFRLHNVRVFGSSFDTTPFEYIEADVKLLLKWYRENKRKLNPLALTAIFHEKFERIHPFYDGNGRTGRMISNLILIRNGFPPLIIENRRRAEYYDALSKGHRADLTKTEINEYKPIVNFFYKELKFTYDKIFSKWM